MVGLPIYCDKCETTTDHTHIMGRVCICPGCGAEHKATAAAVKKLIVQSPKPEIKDEPEEKEMKHLTKEQIEAMRADWRAMSEGQQGVTGIQILADKYEVSKPTVRKYLKAELKALRVSRRAAKKANRVERALSSAAPEGHTAHKVEAGGGFKSALARMVHDEVERQVAVMHKEFKASLRDIDLDPKIEAAMAPWWASALGS